MNLDYKIADYRYCESGITHVTIAFRGRRFMGIAVKHPDEPVTRKFLAGDLAETRAAIAAYQWELENKRKECKTVENFIKSFAQMKSFDNKSETAKAMYHQFNFLTRDIEYLKNVIHSLKTTCRYLVENIGKPFPENNRANSLNFDNEKIK